MKNRTERSPIFRNIPRFCYILFVRLGSVLVSFWVSFGTILVSKSILGGSGGTLGAPVWPRPEKVGSLAALGAPFWEPFWTLFGTGSFQIDFFVVFLLYDF